MTDQFKTFTEDFFKNLKAELVWKGEVLVVDKVPERFEKFFGKKAPYNIVFDNASSDKGEVVAKGSYLLKAMKSFLDKSGETTLLKINFDINPEKEIISRIKLSNCQITRATKKTSNHFLTRLTFQTNFQYLNKRETLITQVFIKDGQCIDLNLDDYKTSEGDKRELEVQGLKEDYEVAKDQLRVKIKSKIDEISEFLKEQLDKEVARIREHYNQRKTEGQEGILSAIDRMEALKKQLVKNPDDEPKIKEKIKKLQEEIYVLRDKTKEEDFEQKEEFEIQSEKQKHNLAIGNKLINTTIIYYPSFVFDVFLKNKSAARIIEVKLNPFSKTMSEFFCENCNKKLNSLYICSSGHISCKECLSQCELCGNELCSKCMTKVCSTCGKKMCKSCTLTCSACSKPICKTHALKDKTTGKTYCKNCLQYCLSCFEHKEPKYFKLSPSKGVKVCAQCYAKEIGKKAVEGLFD